MSESQLWPHERDQREQLLQARSELAASAVLTATLVVCGVGGLILSIVALLEMAPWVRWSIGTAALGLLACVMIAAMRAEGVGVAQTARALWRPDDGEIVKAGNLYGFVFFWSTLGLTVLPRTGAMVSAVIYLGMLIWGWVPVLFIGLVRAIIRDARLGSSGR